MQGNLAGNPGRVPWVREGIMRDVTEDVGPGIGERGAVEIVRSADGEAFFRPAIRPRAWDRMGGEGRSMLAGVQRIASQIHEMQGHLGEHVMEARDLGASWDLIGWSVGTTGEAARQRWGSAS
jgi:hypothetical protein